MTAKPRAAAAAAVLLHLRRQPIAESRDSAEALYAFALDLVCAPLYRHLTAGQRAAKLNTAINLMLKGLTRK